MRSTTLGSCSLPPHQPSEQDHTAFKKFLDLYWTSPESGGVWYTSRRLKKYMSCSTGKYIRAYRSPHICVYVDDTYMTRSALHVINDFGKLLAEIPRLEPFPAEDADQIAF